MVYLWFISLLIGIFFFSKICQDRENSLLLKLNASARTNQLPIFIYESMIEIEEGATKVLYSPVTYTLATEEAERIGMDHIARVSIAGAKESSAGTRVYVHVCVCVSECVCVCWLEPGVGYCVLIVSGLYAIDIGLIILKINGC